jgi:Carboxypeptidase regulatory-like domain
MHNKFRLLLLAVALLSLAARTTIPVMAQNPTGSIRGTVTDQNGAVILNASITATSKATRDVRKVSTGSDGIYAIENLLPGEYSVKVEAQGFATQNITDLIVQTGSTTSGDASLHAGGAGEVVDVVADAPTINRENFKIDGVITRQKVDALPLNGRNFLQLALLEPGVAVSTKNPGSQNNLFNVSIGGASAALTRLTVDGGSILDPVCGGAAQNFSTETVQEFQISTFNFDLSTGITSVGSINIVSRTGTNDFHGNTFLYFRDHSLSAIPTLARPKTDPFFRRYQYGGAFGGPIKKDRVFFFGNFERLDQTSVISTFITGAPQLAFFNTATSSPYKGILGNVRVDAKLSEKNMFFARYSHDDNNVFAPDSDNSLPSNWRVNKNNDDNALAALTTVFTQTLVNDFRFNFQRIVNNETIPTAAECPPSNVGCIGLGGVQIRVNNSNLQLGDTVNAPQARNLKRYQFTDSLSWQKGAHALKFGGEFEHNYGFGLWAFLDPALIVVHDPRDVVATNAAVSAFLPAVIQPLYTIPLAATFKTTGSPVTLDDLLSLPLAVAFIGIGDPSQPPPFQTNIARQSNRARFYVQDSWKIKPNFTFSFGASYAYETNLQNHDLTKPALISKLIGSTSKPGKDTNNIAPSLGFAWDVGGKGKTVIRGGAGIYYDTVLFVTRLRERSTIGPAGNGRSQLTGDYFQNSIPFTRIPGITGSLSLINPAVGTSLSFTTIPTKFTGANFMSALNTQSPIIQAGLSAAGAAGFTGIDFFKTGTDILDPGLQIPLSEQMSFGVQHQFGGNLSLSADFVLRKQVHQLFQNDYNNFKRVAALGGPILPQCVGAAAVNPVAQCSNGPISVIQSGGRNDYRALLVKLDKRFSSRYQLTASYALSSLTGFFTGEDLTDYFRYHGALGGDSRHRLTISGVVNLPWDFQASLIAVYASRGPFNANIASTNDLNGDGTFGDTLPGLKINSLGRATGRSDFLLLVNQFNATLAGKPDAAGATIKTLAVPANFRFGDDFQSEDIRITKTFKIHERFQVQGFFEVFNLFNIANLGGFNSSLTSGNFGTPTTRAGQNFGTGGPRAIQLGGRFSF